MQNKLFEYNLVAAVVVRQGCGCRCVGLVCQKFTTAALNMVHFDKLHSKLAIAILCSMEKGNVAAVDVSSIC